MGATLLVDGDPNHTALGWADEGKLPFEVVGTNRVARAVGGKEWVVFDTPARPNSEELEELVKGCDLLVLPTTPDIVSIRPLIATIRELGEGQLSRADFDRAAAPDEGRPPGAGRTARAGLSQFLKP